MQASLYQKFHPDENYPYFRIKEHLYEPPPLPSGKFGQVLRECFSLVSTHHACGRDSNSIMRNSQGKKIVFFMCVNLCHLWLILARLLKKHEHRQKRALRFAHAWRGSTCAYPSMTAIFSSSPCGERIQVRGKEISLLSVFIRVHLWLIMARLLKKHEHRQKRAFVYG